MGQFWLSLAYPSLESYPPAPLSHSKLGSIPWWLLPLSPPSLLSQSAQAAVTKCHRLGGLNNRHLFSLRSGGWKSKSRVLTWLDSGYSFISGLQMATFWLCPDTAERQREVGERERKSCSLSSSPYKGTSLIMGPSRSWLYLKTKLPPKGPTSKYQHFAG